MDGYLETNPSFYFSAFNIEYSLFMDWSLSSYIGIAINTSFYLSFTIPIFHYTGYPNYLIGSVPLHTYKASEGSLRTELAILNTKWTSLVLARSVPYTLFFCYDFATTVFFFFSFRYKFTLNYHVTTSLRQFGNI